MSPTRSGAPTAERPLVPGVEAALDARLRAGMESVQRRLQEVVDHDDPFIAGASRYLADAGGKRFRPLLTLLCAEVGGGSNDQVVDAAVAVELTHLASLYHDDVMDEATLRRGVPSANVAFDNSTAILVGDLLFAKASTVVADLGPDAVRRQAETFQRLCSGQIRDDRPAHPGADPVDYYLGVLADKTGSLIATAAAYGAEFGGCPPELTATLTAFGERLGVVFQLADDLLDIASEADRSGKTPGTDLREGKATLPVLYALSSTDPADARLRELLSGPVRPEDLTEALTLLRGHRAMDEAAEHTTRLAEEATALLAGAGDSPALEALRSLVTGVAVRSA